MLLLLETSLTDPDDEKNKDAQTKHKALISDALRWLPAKENFESIENTVRN